MKPNQQKIKALLDLARPVMALQDKSIRTERQYFFYIQRYLEFTYSRPVDEASERKFEHWLGRMVLDNDVAVATQNVAFNAVVWFYKWVLKRELKNVNGLRAQRPATVRTALPFKDVCRLLDDVRDVSGYPTHFITQMLYRCGMRLSDATSLRVKDLVFDRKEIIIRSGKGKKDRVLGMPAELVTGLQRQLVVAHQTWEQDFRNKIPVQLPTRLGRKYPELRFSWHWAFVFPARSTCLHPRTHERVRYHVPPNKVQEAVRDSRRRLNLDPATTPHVLRHSFATHLLDGGINVKALQLHMGHNDPRTTMGYCHAEAKSVPDPIERHRAMTLTVLPLAAPRVNLLEQAKS
jgi:site-specific recombinase XerD